MKVYANLDLTLNQLKNARLDPVYEDPSIDKLQEGRIWYNMLTDEFKYFDGQRVEIIQPKTYLNNADIDSIWDDALRDN